jgi:tetratricopeptide (TPR) repeat protein
MAYPPTVHSTLAKLARAEIAGVNAHTLPVALDRAERDGVAFEQLDERQLAIALLQRISYPETMQELSLFLNVGHALNPTTLVAREISGQHAVAYMPWLAGFLNDPEANIQKNARILLRWVVGNYQQAIAADQSSLDVLRRIADDAANSWKNAAFIAYALGVCGTVDDYDRVIRLAEIVIEHDREHAEMVADALYRLHPPALINALQYFLEHAPANSKQFIAGIHLLAKVAEIDDQQFWNTYYKDMDQIVTKLADLVGHNPTVERILDLIEKHLALAEDEE